MLLSTRARAGFLLALLITALSSAVISKDLPSAKPEDVGLSSERLARMDKAIHAYVDAGRTPGVVTLIARHGKVVHVDAYGKADVVSGRPIRADDIFRMFSMTKPITSTALLMLYEEGKFQLTDPLSRFLPPFADTRVYAGSTSQGGMRLDSLKRPITIQDVFRHTAGFSYGLFGDTPVDKAYNEADVLGKDLPTLIDKVAKLPLLAQPGERWIYSVAHDVQAALVEKISGQKFDDGDAAFGGHSISTTIGDYALFAQMLLNKGQLNGARLLSPKTVELMATNHLPAAAMAAGGVRPGTGYGLGVSVLLDPAAAGNLGSMGEFGWSGAANTHVFIDPRENLVAIYCTQLMLTDFTLRSEFATLLYQSIVGN